MFQQHITRSSPRVLLVEDDRRLLAAIQTRFDLAGYRCVACDNASEAMQQYSGGDFDLVITDINMRGIDGIGIIGMIREQNDVPIIVISGQINAYAHVVDTYENVHFLDKPFGMEQLMACARQARHGPRHASK
ncbi:MAG TPA: response regulator [Tepidisphaeraceae bacterium]|nr:response regulator [Tepidisphaeraceae bacterium]